jgi:adenosylcobinamide-GDP ribazoletransferase
MTRLLGDLAIALVFFTRLPLPPFEIRNRTLGDAIWAAPIVGLVVAIAGGLVYTIAHALGINEGIAAALALATTMLFTGCLHEDGLADTADAFGGGKTMARKLEIMRDSRIGTYGAAILIMSVLLRWTALAALPGGAAVVCSLIAAHVASRGVFGVMIQRTPLARDTGLATAVGQISDPTALAGMILAGIALLLLGIGPAILAAMFIAALLYGFRNLCIRQIGGMTGDTLGTAQQIVEITVLVIASAILS